MSEATLDGRRILVGVGGSVAAFKSGLVVTELRRRGAEVRVAMTRGAERFITAQTLHSLSGHPVAVSLWDAPAIASDPDHGMAHLSLGAWAELQVVVAASANLIARSTAGMADDALTASILACEAPLLIAPAMEAAMWRNAATRANVLTLESRGVRFIGPESGRLASGKQDVGRMSEPAAIVAVVENTLAG